MSNKNSNQRNINKGNKRDLKQGSNRDKPKRPQNLSNVEPKMKEGSTNNNKENFIKEGRYGWNNISWYNKYPELLDATAKLAFPNKPGMSLKDAFNVLGNPTYPTAKQDYGFPGIMCIHWIPSIGINNNNTDPAAIAARELYSRVRSKFSSKLAADAPDFLIQILAMDSIYAYFSYLRRMYRILNTVSPDNYLYPYAFLQTMGFTQKQVSKLLEDRLKLFGAINTLIRTSDKIRCPKVFDLIERHSWMSENIYLDADIKNAQSYVMVPDGFYKFTLLDTPDSVKAGGLEFKPFYPGKLDEEDPVKALYDFGEELISSLCGWESAYDINGYLREVFADTPMYEIPLLAEDESIIPSFNTEVLVQIHNASALTIDPSWLSDPTTMTINNNITQDPKTNSLICNPTIVFAGKTEVATQPFFESGFLDVPVKAPTPIEVMVASRLHTSYDQEVNATGAVCTPHAASEIVLYFGTAFPNFQSEFKVVHFGSLLYIPMNAVASNELVLSIHHLINSGAYTYHPIFVYNIFNGTLGYNGLLGEVYNITLLPTATKTDMDRVAMYSEFNSFGIR